ncbi:MAG: hypothetical protein FWE62_01355 [Firmicutes bacterium]|nr:hypothetical protein [Bacillota bacterium]
MSEDRSCLGAMLLFFFGMLTGVIVFLGALFGVGYALANYYTIGQVGSWINQRDKVSREIEDKTILELARDLYKTFGDIDSVTLNQISRQYGYSLTPQFKGIDITPIFDEPILTISGKLNKITDNIMLRDLGDLAALPGDEDRLFYLLRDGYLTESDDPGSDRLTIKQIYEELTLGDLVGDVQSGVLSDENLRNVKLSQINSELSGAFKDVRLCTVMDDIDDSKPKLLRTLCGYDPATGVCDPAASYKIGELADAIGDLQLCDIIDIPTDPEAPGYMFLNSLANKRIDYLAEAVGELRLCDIIQCDDPDMPVVYHFRDTKLDDLSDKIAKEIFLDGDKSNGMIISVGTFINWGILDDTYKWMEAVKLEELLDQWMLGGPAHPPPPP